MNPGNKITAIGDINLDIILRYSPEGMEKTIMDYSFSVGGSTFNTAIILANSGCEVDFYGTIGNNFPSEHLKTIKKIFKNSHLEKVNEKNGLVVSLSGQAERQLLSYRGNNKFEYSGLPSKGDILLLSSYFFIDHHFENIDNFKYRILCVGDSKTDIPKKIVDKFNMIFMNEKQFEVGKFKNIEKNKEVIITLGKNGSMVIKNGKKYPQKQIPRFNIIDTTGSGDAFAAGYIYARLINKMNIIESQKIANRCGGTAASIFGTGLNFIKEKLDLSKIKNF